MNYFECVGITKCNSGYVYHCVSDENPNDRTLGKEVVSAYSQDSYSIGDKLRILSVRDSNGTYKKFIIK